ncbi:helix-turn-helix domain-containing protein [Rhizobium giardinii]|jgi:transcriptional regulator with XRE-family HTH domain|uniref:Transcriptional regulator with XRE-family HTH domain n=1 Tax=Rhizobium giardinii TaxID=56731 RepID=A0A7W8U8P7_9HYPH|nr:helix-turn-helix transcriptional regulator [Rhizobium giardinii]MBB5533967.1 transcriptional regulator with XRE-family HTH domain [Rhizobium giardinii]
MTISTNNAAALGNSGMPPVEIGEAVKRFREASGYSIEDLAVTCGLTDVEISRIETGEDVDPGRVKRIAAALQMPASILDSL